MKERLQEILRCPRCGGRFELSVAAREGAEVMEGSLSCRPCAASYPVSRGVPRILPGDVEAKKTETAGRFGEEWHLFDDLGPIFERELLAEYIAPLEPSVFRGASVLECGCGSGRNIIRIAEYGAREVVGVDLGSSVDVAFRKSRHLPNVHVVQADIFAIPLGGDFDVVFSAGVLHHLPDPGKGFQATMRHLRPGGTATHNVYSAENNAWLDRWVTPLRLALTARLDSRVLYWASFFVSLPVHLMLVAFYRPLNEFPWTRPLAARLFYNDYAFRMSKIGFRATWVQIFDQLTAPVAFFLSRAELERWTSAAGLKDVRFHWRNKNSWNFTGTK